MPSLTACYGQHRSDVALAALRRRCRLPSSRCINWTSSARPRHAAALAACDKARDGPHRSAVALEILSRRHRMHASLQSRRSDTDAYGGLATCLESTVSRCACRHAAAFIAAPSHSIQRHFLRDGITRRLTAHDEARRTASQRRRPRAIAPTWSHARIASIATQRHDAGLAMCQLWPRVMMRNGLHPTLVSSLSCRRDHVMSHHAT